VLHQRTAVRRGGGERLVHDHRDAGVHGRGRELDVGAVRGGHHDQVEVAVPELAGVRQDLRTGMTGPDLGLPLGVAGDDRVQAQPGGGRDERGVEHRAADAVPEQPDAHVHAPSTSRAPGTSRPAVPQGPQYLKLSG
jgi:hypothetical protein